jgi:branched-chain amino acid transport system substrate-binding protein
MMPARLDRRTFLQAAALTALPMGVARAQETKPLRIGLLCVKTGPLASGGIAMEQGLTLFLRERNNTLAGRKTELFVADTGGAAGAAKPKAQELVERDKVDFIVGPLAAYEALAINAYIRQVRVPTIGFAAAEDLTQRKPNPYFIRASSTAAQAAHPLAYYAATQLKYKRMITLADDFAFGYEQVGGFQRVFEDNGGEIVKKLWPPLKSPDYAPYLAQIKGADAIFIGFAGSNALKFIRQYAEFGLKLPILGGQSVIDESQLQAMGDAAVGVIDALYYTSEVDTPSNKRLIGEIEKTYHSEPGGYSVTTYTAGQFIEAALRKTGGHTDDRAAVMRALRSVSLTDTPRGPMRIDHLGNPIENIYLCEVKRINGKLVNTIIKTFPNVSQFWTYDEKWFLAQPVYSRNYPPAKHLEQ